uniref:DUF7802 domain-containing protein n=1 Tax=Romanomermis culicivorax TaxID=13658 RepID=A0A915I6W5_ROMCU
LHLPWFSRSCASGLLSLLLGIPYFLLGAKHLWFTFHDTDPNVKDRFYGVPYTVLLFLLSAGCSLDLTLTVLRRLILPLEYNWKLFFREFCCALAAGFVAFWLMPLFFVPFHNAFHDQFGVSCSLCILAPILIFAFAVWISDRNPHKLSRPNSQNGYNQYWFDELCVLITIYFLFFMALVLIWDPATVSSSGLHEPIGPCDSYEKVGSILGDLIMKRRRYLCPTRFNKANFDFSCLPPSASPKMRDGVPLEWYTICGTKVDNFIEYCFATWLFCIMGLATFFVAFAESGELPKIAYKSFKKRKHE